MKPIRCTNFSIILEMKLYMFRTVALSIITSYSPYTQRWYMSYRFVDSFRAGSWACCSEAVWKPVWHIPLLCVQWITPDDGQRNCPKQVDFHFQNKFEKLVHLVGFIIRRLVKYNPASLSRLKRDILYNILSNIHVERLVPYVGKITGDRHCGFRHNNYINWACWSDILHCSDT
jgi:hypothetical protein